MQRDALTTPTCRCMHSMSGYEWCIHARTHMQALKAKKQAPSKFGKKKAMGDFALGPDAYMSMTMGQYGGQSLTLELELPPALKKVGYSCADAQPVLGGAEAAGGVRRDSAVARAVKAWTEQQQQHGLCLCLDCGTGAGAVCVCVRGLKGCSAVLCIRGRMLHVPCRGMHGSTTHAMLMCRRRRQAHGRRMCILTLMCLGTPLSMHGCAAGATPARLAGCRCWSTTTMPSCRTASRCRCRAPRPSWSCSSATRPT